MRLIVNSKPSFLLIVVLIFFQGITNAQSPVLGQYIEQAIESNAALKQKQLSYEKSLFTLKEAKQMFFPIISIVAQYEYNYGGRTINMPFGDMLNPAYDNLDIINGINAQIPNYPNIPEYPQIENIEAQLSPEEQQRTQLELEMPIYNQALISNKKLKEQLVSVNKINAEYYKKQLIKEVKTAYLDYLMSLQTIDVGNTALELIKTSLVTSNSLYKNDKITIDEVYKAEAKVKEVEYKILEINKGVTLTKAYFNFLLNRKFDEEIEIDETFSNEDFLLEDVNFLVTTALNNRDEIKLLDLSLQIDKTNIKMEKSAFLPLFYLNASTGFWSDDYKFNKDTYFASASISVKWDIFTGGQTKSRVQQAKIDKLITVEKKKDLENNISLEVVEAYYNVKTVKESLELSRLETKNYRESLKIIDKKKQQNLASQLEYDVAFNDYFEAEISYLNNKNKYLQKIIELEFSINK